MGRVDDESVVSLVLCLSACLIVVFILFVSAIMFDAVLLYIAVAASSLFIAVVYLDKKRRNGV